MNQILSDQEKNPEKRRKKTNNSQINNNYTNRNQQHANYYANSSYNNSLKNRGYNNREYNNKKAVRSRKNSRNYRNSYYNRTQTTDIVKIARIFAIMLIVYGLAIIGQSAYALNSSQYKPKDNVQVSIDKMGREVTVIVEAQKPLKEIKYRWNDGEETKILTEGRTKIEQKIDIPNGNNLLKITVYDHYGNKTNYQRQYLYESKDSIKPNIETSVSGTKITITVSDETKLSYLTYKWNDEGETRYDVPNGQKLVTLEIEVMQGKNTFTVNAVDGEDNKTTFSKMIIGDTKPEVSILTEGTNVVVKAKDDEGIAKLEIKIDGEVSEEETGNNTEINAKIPVSAGTHEIKAVVTNVNGLKASKEITADV